MVLNDTYIYNIGQKISLKNNFYKNWSDGLIIKITKSYLICQKVRTNKIYYIDENDKYYIHNKDINDKYDEYDNNDNYNVYGRYSKKNKLGQLEDIEDNTLIKVHFNNAYALEKQEINL
jgi:hypothetical protein